MSTPHYCPGRGCDKKVGRLVACASHWNRLPAELRTEIGRAENRHAGTPLHERLVLEAVQLLRDGYSPRWGSINTDGLEIVGTAEIAELAGVGASTVRGWRARYADFPPHFVELECGPLYRAGQVRAWLALHAERTK